MVRKVIPKGDSSSPGCTLFSAGGMAQIGEWSRFINHEQTFPRVDSFSLGCTLFSTGGMAQGAEWSRFNNQGHAFPRADSFSPGFTMISAGGMVQAQKSGTIILLCFRRIVQIANVLCFTF